MQKHARALTHSWQICVSFYPGINYDSYAVATQIKRCMFIVLATWLKIYRCVSSALGFLLEDKPLSVQTHKGFLKRDVCLVIRLHCQTDCKSSSVFWNVKQLCERGLTPYPLLLPSSSTWVGLQLFLWQAAFNTPCTQHSFRIMVLCLPRIHRIMCRRYKSSGRKWVLFPLSLNHFCFHQAVTESEEKSLAKGYLKI